MSERVGLIVLVGLGMFLAVGSVSDWAEEACQNAQAGMRPRCNGGCPQPGQQNPGGVGTPATADPGCCSAKAVRVTLCAGCFDPANGSCCSIGTQQDEAGNPVICAQVVNCQPPYNGIKPQRCGAIPTPTP